MNIKKKILDGFEKFLHNNLENITDDELEIALYGMEVIYSLITKMIFYFIISLMLNCYREFFIVMLILTAIRATSFGFHAENEISCYLSSFLAIFGTIYLAKNYNFSLAVVVILCSVSFAATVLFAPADTEKRPLLNKKTRSILKLCSSVTVLFFSIIAINNIGFVSNSIVCILLINSINISPILYKIFKRRYKNYEYY